MSVNVQVTREASLFVVGWLDSHLEYISIRVPQIVARLEDENTTPQSFERLCEELIAIAEASKMQTECAVDSYNKVGSERWEA